MTVLTPRGIKGGPRRETMSKNAVFVYGDTLSRHVPREDHPLRSIRLRYTYELLEAYQAFEGDGSTLVDPRSASELEIRSIHTEEYLEAVKSLSRAEGIHDPGRFNFSAAGDNPVYEGMYEAAILSTGASLVAAESILTERADVAFNISGGLHHAAAGHASGFCVFNDPAIAINLMLSKGLRVVYVDIDAHHGDGVQNAFYDTDRVLTISLHESGKFLFPGTGFVEETGVGAGEGFSVNVPLYPYTDDDTYLWTFREVVLPLVDAFKPDVLVTQLGIDSYHNDPLTHLMLSSQGFTEAVAKFAEMGYPWLATGGGGYDVGAVARCWTLAYGIMAQREWPDKIPPEYEERRGSQHLRDVALPVAAQPDVRQAVQSLAETSVEQVKRLIFPAHKLS